METRFEFFGALGEKLFKAWLKDRGYFVVPAHLIDTGGAPLLEGFIRNHVLPDVLACKNGQSAWIDVKAKSRPTKNNKYQRLECGFEFRKWRDYLAVEKATGIPGAIAFVVAKSRRLYFGTFSVLSGNYRVFQMTPEWRKAHPHHAFKEDMIFFDLARCDSYSLEDFALLKQFASAAPPPVTVRPWEQDSPKSKQLDLFS